MSRIANFIGFFLVSSFSVSAICADDIVSILQLAMANDPTLKQAEANYRANRENVIQSRAILLPSLGIQAATSRLTSGPTNSVYINVPDPISGNVVRTRVIDDHSFRPGINNHNWGVGLNQSVLNMANWYNLQSARASDKAAAVSFAAQEQDLIMRVSVAYFDVLRALDALETNNQEETAAQRSLDQTQQREAVGLIAITDVYDSQAAYDLARNLCDLCVLCGEHWATCLRICDAQDSAAAACCGLAGADRLRPHRTAVRASPRGSDRGDVRQ